MGKVGPRGQIRRIAPLTGLALAALTLAACNQLPACDDAKVQADWKQKVKAEVGVEVKSISDIKTVSRTDQSATCSMKVTAADGTNALFTYRLDKTQSGYNAVVTDGQ
jgi:hypothetical protein